MTATSLPTEIWVIIAQIGSLVRKDLHSVTLVGKDFNHIFTPALYSFLAIFIDPDRIPHVLSNTTTFNLGGTPTQRLLELLESSEIHRDFVRTVDFRKDPSIQRNLRMAYGPIGTICFVVGSIMELLAKLTGLQSLSISGLPLQDEWIYRIAERPLNSLCIHGCSIFDGPIIHGPLSVTKLQVDHLFVPLIYYGNVEALDYDGELISLYQAIPSGLSSLQLKTLTMGWLNIECLEFFRYTPNLSEISIEIHETGPIGYGGFDYSDHFRPGDWNSFLPMLQSWSGPLALVPLFVSGRPITSITCKSTWSGHTADGMSQLGPSFGSKVPVRNLFWRGPDSRLVLDYLVKHNPEVYVVHLCDELEISNEEFLLLLEGFKKLSQLRHLRLPRPIIERNRAHFEWERAQCEILKKNGGCGQLETVGWSWDTEWNWCYNDIVWKPSDLGVKTLLAGE